MSKKRFVFAVLFLLVFFLMQSCEPATLTAPIPTPTYTVMPNPTETATPDPASTNVVTFQASQSNVGLTLRLGGDHDIEHIQLPDTGQAAIRSGNGIALPADDKNDVPDSYIQFQVDDAFLYSGIPTSRVVFIIEYLDEGMDAFNVQYDALSGGSYGSGQFKDLMEVHKTGTGEVKTVEIPVCDAYFANRDQDADFRIADHGDGAETILRVAVRQGAQVAGPLEINVDSCGAHPFDALPDSDAIQACLSQACSGDTILFSSGVNEPGYQGYLIDKTIFLVYPHENHDLTFRSTDENDHALLKATAELKGFVVHLFSRWTTHNPGLIDNVTIKHLDIDSNRAERVCNGARLDGQEHSLAEGENDNWGSWLPECSAEDAGDAWCNAGSLYIGGAFDPSDPTQDFVTLPDDWSTGMVVQDVTLSNTECGTAFFFSGASYLIDSVTVDLAGEHTHFPGCQLSESDDHIGAWADGITFVGPAHQLTNNTIMDASDIGIVSFGGRDILIANNTILARPGNHGMFAGIAMHPNTLGLISGLEVTGNQVINEADPSCGGIHMGINLGVHTWSNGCIGSPDPATYGTADDCSVLAPAPEGALCATDTYCRTWGHVARDDQVTLADNVVQGAQVSFAISGLDVLGGWVLSGNESINPHLVDWEFDTNCVWEQGFADSWGILDFVAFNPSLQGWTEQRIFCAR